MFKNEEEETKMQCKRCMVIMTSGTTYERRKDGKTSSKRFYECKKCHDKIYTKEPNFQEYIDRLLDGCINR